MAQSTRVSRNARCPSPSPDSTLLHPFVRGLLESLSVGSHWNSEQILREEIFSVERLEQRYVRMEDDGTRQRYDYTSPAFDFRAELIYDGSGLVLAYPGIATRTA